MARITEPSEPANTLLNPLQNPLLAENIHRWAEVYFTNPPERRDVAVAELLLELEREKRQKDELLRKVPTAQISQAGEVARVVGEPVTMAKCVACGHENPVSHQFCGMCGQRVDAKRAEATQPELIERAQSGPRLENFAPAPQQPVENLREDGALGEVGEADIPAEDGYVEDGYVEERESDEYVPAFANSDLSLFQSLRAPHDVDEEEWEYGPQRSGSYRFYVAAVLILLIGGLGYLAWRSEKASQAVQQASPPPPAPATESAEPPTPPASTAKPSAPPEAAKQSAPTNEEKKSDEAKNPVVRASKTQRLAPKEAPASTAASGNGAEELGIAQGYLNGTNGRSRDGSEAAKWLWKSMAKHNGQASVMLADLYLKGDGVPKSCDQGRILLDSAAQRGVPGAGERLRNLRAFGCR